MGGGAIGAHWPCFQRGLVVFVEEVEIFKRVLLSSFQLLPQVALRINI